MSAPAAGAVLSKRCASCFTELAEDGLCAKCEGRERSEIALPLRQTLREGRYYVGRTLGDPGGFGMTYLGWDSALQRKVALKEYFPWRTAMRVPNSSQAQPMSQSVTSDYKTGLQGFLDEARRLAALDHQNVVKVLDYLEANGTGYIMMPFYEGQDLGSYLEERGGKLPWREVVDIMLPLLDGLQQVHDAGLIHRDIKPGNIYLAKGARGEARPILIDFGAARWATSTHELTAILTEGFAPLEQYPGCGAQGPTTDIYAVAATAYALISGRVPATAPARTAGFNVQPLHELAPDVPLVVSEAIDCGLSLKPDDRPQRASVFARMLRDAASGTVKSVRPSVGSAAQAPTMIIPPTRVTPMGVPATRDDRMAKGSMAAPTMLEGQQRGAPVPAVPAARSSRGKLIAIAAGVVVLASAGAGVALMSGNGSKTPPDTSSRAAGPATPAPGGGDAPSGGRDTKGVTRGGTKQQPRGDPGPGTPAGGGLSAAARTELAAANTALKDGRYDDAMQSAVRLRAVGSARAADSLAVVVSEACIAEQKLLAGRGDVSSCPKRP
ncbi:MAG: protein kinase [Gemmatimonadetes bacterium]|nr:protein kinase [Gemmatimonadota bacterium]